MSLRLDGLLTQEEELALQTHLGSCQACQEQWEAMLWTSSLLATELAAVPPSAFTARVQHLLQQRELGRQRAIGVLKACLGSVGAWSAAAVVAVVTVAALWTPARILAVDLGVPLLADTLAFTTMFARAGLSGLRALCTTSTAVTLFGYTGLAIALTASWVIVVARFRHSMATDSD